MFYSRMLICVDNIVILRDVRLNLSSTDIFGICVDWCGLSFVLKGIIS
jgi:hypothetical protein